MEDLEFSFVIKVHILRAIDRALGFFVARGLEDLFLNGVKQSHAVFSVAQDHVDSLVVKKVPPTKNLHLSVSDNQLLQSSGLVAA